MNLLGIDDLSKEDMNEIFDIADDVKNGKAEISIKDGSVLALLFKEPSVNTRVSLEVAMSKLGGRSIYLNASGIEINEQSIENLAQMLSAYVDFIALRLMNHDAITSFANSSAVPVINALSDLEHPINALTMLYTIKDKMGAIKGRRLGIIGNTELSTVNSLMLGAAKLGAKVSLISPQQFVPNPVYLVKAREYGVVDAFSDINEGLEGVNVAYVDYFVPSDDKEKKEALSKFAVSKDMLNNFGVSFVLYSSSITSAGQEEAETAGEKGATFEQNRNRLAITQALILFLSEKSV
ncbi:MAG: ornithine carbamoyltransferase [Candidatus Micrarchaeia archaeon]